MDLQSAGVRHQIQLAELEAWKEKAYLSARLYKDRTKRWHDKWLKIKSFKLCDKVLLFNSRVRLFGHGKLRSKWEGPFTVLEAPDHGAITLQDNDRRVFKDIIICSCLTGPQIYDLEVIHRNFLSSFGEFP